MNIKGSNKIILAKNLLALMFLALVFSGCGTIITNTTTFQHGFQSENCNDEAPHKLPRVYSGLTLDLWTSFVDLPKGGQTGAFLFWDIPFSFAMDTLYLPITSYKQITKGSLTCLNNEKQNHIKTIKANSIEHNENGDIVVLLDLRKSFVEKNKYIEFEGDDFVEIDPQTTEEALAWYILVPITIAYKAITNDTKDIEIYFYPVDHKDRYLQQLKWGQNEVYIPNIYMKKKVEIIIELVGVYHGKFKTRLDLSEPTQLVLE